MEKAVLPPTFYEWFGGSKAVNRDGSPMICFHGTYHSFTAFAPLSHFGTAKAAKDRLADKKMKEGSRTIPVYLMITNPLRVTDAEASDEATMLGAVIKGRYPDLDAGLMRREGNEAALLAAGYDGMVYSNHMEDRGKDSWVIVTPNQVRSIFDF